MLSVHLVIYASFVNYIVDVSPHLQPTNQERPTKKKEKEWMDEWMKYPDNKNIQLFSSNYTERKKFSFSLCNQIVVMFSRVKIIW